MTHFMPTSGVGELLILDDWKVSGLVPRLILAASDDSSFCLLGKVLLQLGTPLQVFFCGVHPSGGVKVWCRCLQLG